MMISYEYRYICSFTYFLEYVLLFLDDMWMKNVNNFQSAKIQSEGVA